MQRRIALLAVLPALAAIIVGAALLREPAGLRIVLGLAGSGLVLVVLGFLIDWDPATYTSDDPQSAMTNNQYAWLSLVFGSAATSLASAAATRAGTGTGRTEFFAVGAQVLPVLLLAVLLEQRLVRVVRRTIDIFLLVWTTVAIFAAEAWCLRVVHLGTPQDGDAGVVIMGLGAGAAALLYVFVKLFADDVARLAGRV